ncbi:MAG: transglycosylase domain-containing protein [Gammaproteobacteria bacterium]
MKWRLQCWLVLAAGGTVGALIAFSVIELQTSEFQAPQLAAFARKLYFIPKPGPSPAIRFPAAGPYDKRLGYSELPRFLKRLHATGFQIESQARFSPALLRVAKWGLFPTYHEKDQAGLEILDRRGARLFFHTYPQHIYKEFDAVPPLVVGTLLAIENRELLDPRYPKRNPAVEWDRLFKAAVEYPQWVLHNDTKGPGGSTLATQLEKARHSAEGLTKSPLEKLRQMASASLRAYLDGEETLDAQKRVIVHYLNSLPLAAVPGQGEVIGLAAGLDAWFGADFLKVNRLLSTRTVDISARGLAYKQVLCLLLAQRRPTDFLVKSPQSLLKLTDAYLRVLAKEHLISVQLRDAALGIPLLLKGSVRMNGAGVGSGRKLANVVRARLGRLLGLQSIYDVDRLDLTVESTLDNGVQQAVARRLAGLRDTEQVTDAGLTGKGLLDEGDPSRVTYSFILYERGAGANWVRVQADNFYQAFDINEGLKLDLGSTAKLRTLVTYLKIIAQLHQRYAGFAPQDLNDLPVHPADKLTQWVIEELSQEPDLILEQLLKRAMDKRYSASPGESFYTGGGLHQFKNFDRKDNGRVLAVREAFRRSVNLVFIRLMRDIVRYHQYQLPGYTADMLNDSQHWLRDAYLKRFAYGEGQQYLVQFYRKYAGLTLPEAFATLLKGVHLTPIRLATILRSLQPGSSFEAFSAQMLVHLPQIKHSPKQLKALYDAYGQEQYNLQDRGYIARVHPLELWVVAYLTRRPNATLAQVLEASAPARLEAYNWLFKTRRKGAQDHRIRTLLERDAFMQIHYEWGRLGYPFSFLVPSYATAIGASADRPASLAELIGILLNDGVRYSTFRLKRLRFAEGTPYETVAVAQPSQGERVLEPEVAATVRQALVETVESGTAKRAYAVFTDLNKQVIPVGGKTGTGDHRHKTFARGARLVKERAVTRSATFVFLIGERFFGVITAHVAGEEAAKYRFTSALAVQLFRVLAPDLQFLIHHPSTYVAQENTLGKSN